MVTSKVRGLRPPPTPYSFAARQRVSRKARPATQTFRGRLHSLRSTSRQFPQTSPPLRRRQRGANFFNQFIDPLPLQARRAEAFSSGAFRDECLSVASFRPGRMKTPQRGNPSGRACWGCLFFASFLWASKERKAPGRARPAKCDPCP